MGKNIEPLGEGREKEVFVSPNDPDKVVGIMKESAESAEEAKAEFYLTKILHLLHPELVPDISARTTEPNAVERERVFGGESTFRQNDAVKDGLFALGVKLDSKPSNYIAEADKPARYVDTVKTWLRNGERNYDPDKIREAVAALPEPDRAGALAYLARLEALHAARFPADTA